MGMATAGIWRDSVFLDNFDITKGRQRDEDEHPTPEMWICQK
jgi:hypothetical protein